MRVIIHTARNPDADLTQRTVTTERRLQRKAGNRHAERAARLVVLAVVWLTVHATHIPLGDDVWGIVATGVVGHLALVVSLDEVIKFNELVVHTVIDEVSLRAQLNAHILRDKVVSVNHRLGKATVGVEVVTTLLGWGDLDATRCADFILDLHVCALKSNAPEFDARLKFALLVAKEIHGAHEGLGSHRLTEAG